MSAKGLVVAVVGATGAVGREMLAVLEERRFPVARLVPLASARSAGERVSFGGDEIKVLELTESSFEGVDLALFSAGGSVSERFAPIAARAGAIVVDNTSAFRMDEAVPLVVPEVNADALAGHRGIIANPNCSTIQLVVALWPLHQAFGLKRLFVSTYQAASGAGHAAMEELKDQTVALLNFREPKVEKFPRRLAFDVLPMIAEVLPEGDTKEERKMVEEPRKIMGLPGLMASIHCVRVPVFVGHSLAVTAEFERPVDLEAALLALEAQPGLILRRDPKAFPTATEAAGQDEVLVGRVRRDQSGSNALSLWVVADNLRKGAATNAVQIAETLVKQGGFKAL